MEDLKAVKAAFANVPEDERPPIVAKDVYIHPLQIAQAIDAGADGVLLMASLVRFPIEEKSGEWWGAVGACFLPFLACAS